MRLFSTAGARHYCSSFQPRSGIAEQSPDEFRDTRLQNRRTVAEGTRLFDEYRTCALRDTERSLFLASSHYRRSLDLMVASSSHWAQVTLYYGAFYAARALLGMFGCAVLHKHVVHVNRSRPGSQELSVDRIGSGQGQYYVTERGSHRQFWEIFYLTVKPVARLVDVKFATALLPVSSSNTWLIEQRNDVNYKTKISLDIAESFGRTFTEDNFPNSLPGALHTQFKVSEGILAASCAFAKRFGLNTDALSFLGSTKPFADLVVDHIYDPDLPNVVDNAKRKEVFGI